MSDTSVDVVRNALILAVARHHAVAGLLASHESPEGFETYLRSEVGSTRLQQLVEALQADEIPELNGDDLTLVTLDTMMELDVLQRVNALEERDEVE